MLEGSRCMILKAGLVALDADAEVTAGIGAGDAVEGVDAEELGELTLVSDVEEAARPTMVGCTLAGSTPSRWSRN